jgi:hypothetical protein
MGQRIDLQALLVGILETNNVYFQPPPTVQMKYPCIVYRRDSANTTFAGDKPYHHAKRYQVIVIDTDPDSDIPGKIAALPMCSYDRFYTADNLNHDVFNLFF